MAITSTEVAKLYVVLFHRAAEKSGVDAWVNLGADKSVADIANLMLESPATKEYYGTAIDTNVDFINKVYENVFNKGAGVDEEGKAAWVARLESTGKTRGEIIQEIIETAATTAAKEKDPTAAKIFENKVALSEYASTKFQEVSKGADGKFDFNQLKDILNGVTDVNLDEKKAELDASLPGKTYDLTAAIDDIVATDSKDTFNGVIYVGKGGKESTLIGFDKIDGKGGEDTLNVFLKLNDNQDLASSQVSLDQHLGSGIKGVENLNIKSLANIVGQNNLDGYANINIETLQTEVLNVKSSSESLSIATNGGANVIDKTAKNVKIDAKGDVTLEANKAEQIEVKGKVVEVTSTEGKSVSVTSQVTATVTAAKATTVSVTSEADAIVTAGAATSVTIKAKDDSKLTAGNNKELNVQTLNVDLGEIDKTLTLGEGTGTGKLNKATDVTLSNLTLAATTLKELTMLNVDTIKLTGDITANKLAQATVKNSNISTQKIVTKAENFDLTLEGKASNVQLESTEALKNLSVHANADSGKVVLADTANTIVEKVVVDGSGKKFETDLSGNNFNKLASIDASAFGGDATIKVKNGAGLVTKSVKLGSGNDTLKLTAAAVADEKYDGGEGKDIVSISKDNVGTSDFTGYTNFEGLRITDSGLDSAALDLAKFGVLNQNLILEKALTDDATVSNLANNGTITLEEFSAHNLTVDIKGDVDSKADILNILVTNDTDSQTTKVTAANVETINFESTKKVAAGGNNPLNTVFELTSNKAEAVNISGASNVEFKQGAGTDVKTVDASSLKGKFTFDATNATKLTSIKGGAQDDVLTFKSAKDLVVEGGAGADTFKIAKGNIAETGLSTNSFATISDFDVTKDKLDLDGHTVNDTNKVVEYKVDVNLDFHNNIVKAIQLAGAAASKVAFFKYEDKTTGKIDTYVVTDDDGNIDGNTTAIKLAGDIDVAAIDHANFI